MEDSSSSSSIASRERSLDMIPDDINENTHSVVDAALPLPSRTLRQQPRRTAKSDVRFKSTTLSIITSARPAGAGDTERATRKRSTRTVNSQDIANTHTNREARVQELKNRALVIPFTGKAPANARQRLVMQMVYDEITPYPDEAWLAQLGIVIDREYHQVKNWFSNQRQKDARDARHEHDTSHTSSASSLRRIICEGRELRLRLSALEYCQPGDWSDSFFEEVVMIYHFRLLAKHSREEARAASSSSVSESLPSP